MWESGRPLSPVLDEWWSPSQPDNANEVEHCVEVRKGTPPQFNDMPCDSDLDGHKVNFVCQKRSTNTDLIEVTTDGVTFETMDTKLPSKDDTFAHVELF